MDKIMGLFVRSPDAIFSEVEVEFVALNINKGQCYGMEHRFEGMEPDW